MHALKTNTQTIQIQETRAMNAFNYTPLLQSLWNITGSCVSEDAGMQNPESGAL